jgi:hypothetical protein
VSLQGSVNLILTRKIKEYIQKNKIDATVFYADAILIVRADFAT